MAVEHERAVARTERGGALATDAPSNPWSDFGILKPHAAGLVAGKPRPDALATISAGTKKAGRDGRMFPSPSKEGEIYVHDDELRAPGLAEALAATDNKTLTIAVMSDEPAEIMQQRFAAYTASRLVAYGDQHAMTVLRVREDDHGKPIKLQDGTYAVDREVVPSSSAKYADIVAHTKAQFSLYFALARWQGTTPEIYFPDGLGLYRLRFTSHNSAENLKASLAYVASLTGGRVAGVPLTLRIVYREVAAPDGSRRRVPIWTLLLQPPEQIQLVPGQVRSILRQGIEQARGLALPVPRPETIEIAEAEGADVDLDSVEAIDGEIVDRVTERDARILAGGGPILNHDRARTEFFLAVGRTSLRDQESRAAFVSAFTHGHTDSLAAFIETTTVKEWARFMEAVADWVRQELEDRQAQEVRQTSAPEPGARDDERRTARTYEELFADDEKAGQATHRAAPSVKDDDLDAQLDAATEKNLEPVRDKPKAGVRAESKIAAAAALTGAPRADRPPTRTALVAELRRLVMEVQDRGDSSVDLPPDLADLTDAEIQEMSAGLSRALAQVEAAAVGES